jgi:hypothetical protein
VIFRVVQITIGLRAEVYFQFIAALSKSALTTRRKYDFHLLHLKVNGAISCHIVYILFKYGQSLE